MTDSYVAVVHTVFIPLVLGLWVLTVFYLWKSDD